MDAVRATAIAEFFVPEERERVVGEYLPNIVAHGRQAWELTLQHFETGDRIPVSYDGFRVDDPETGEPLALATIMRDLTERRRLDHHPGRRHGRDLRSGTPACASSI